MLRLGGGDCDPGESHENDVIVYGKSEGRRERVVLDTLPYSSYRVGHEGYIHLKLLQQLKRLMIILSFIFRILTKCKSLIV